MRRGTILLFVMTAGLLFAAPLQADESQASSGWTSKKNAQHKLAQQAKEDVNAYLFTNVEVPGGFYLAMEQLNSKGVAVGNYCGEPECLTILSFLWKDGHLTPIDYTGGPAPDWVYMYGIDSRGDVFGTVGWAETSSAAVFDPVKKTWSLLPDVSFGGTLYPFSQGYRRNDHSEAVGQSCRLDEAENWTCVGWVWTRAGYSFTTLPGTDSWFTGPLAINNQGDVVGQFLDEDGHVHAYRQHGSHLIELAVPGAVDTYVNDINDNGEILLDGAFDDGSNVNYVLKNGNLVALPGFPGSVNTYSYGFDEKGDFCGMWYDADGAGQGFLALKTGAGKPR